MMARSRRSWHQDIDKPSLRLWEDAQRDRFTVDRLIRTTHGINCGGGCQMEVGVRRGRIAFERPALPGRDGPDSDEPRCCPPGLCAASYVDDSSRVLVPMVRESLLEAWARARTRFLDPVRAWASIVEDAASRRRWQQARGCGGFRATDWETAEEMVAAGLVHTAKQSGPERIHGFSPAPAPALVTAASGLRFLHLLGGVQVDAAEEPEAFRECLRSIWGEDADAPEAGSWTEAEMIVVWGTDPFVTMSADAHRLVAARQRGTRVWALTDVQDATSVRSDRWIPLQPEKSAAFWTAVTRRLLERYFTTDGEGPFDDYVQRFSDAPLLVALQAVGDTWSPGHLLSEPMDQSDGAGSGDRFLIWDQSTDRPATIPGSSAFRGAADTGHWNLRLVNVETGTPVVPVQSMAGKGRALPVKFSDPLTGTPLLRFVPAREIVAHSGSRVMVTTVLDLVLARYGVERASKDSQEHSRDRDSFDDSNWAQKYCGVDASAIDEFVREWGETARRSKGRCLVLVGPDGLRNGGSVEAVTALAHALILTGSMGRPGGGFGYYSGQRKIIPSDSWSFLSMARDWVSAPRKTVEAEPRIALLWGLDPVRLHNFAVEAPPTSDHLDAKAEIECPGTGREPTPDLVVDLTFRVDPTAMYADVLLPAATWYERCDLNSAERPGSLQAIVPVVAPRGESLSEWQIFRRLARRFSALAASYFPEPFLDPVMPAHTTAERRSHRGAVTRDPVPVERDYRELIRRFESLGPERPNPVFAPPPVGGTGDVESDTGEESRSADPVVGVASSCPVEFVRDEAVCDAILNISSATNGEAAYRSFGTLERDTGLELRSLAEPQRRTRIDWSSLTERPRRPLVTPLWSGDSDSHPYAPFTLNVEQGVPWNTITGRQQLLTGIEPGQGIGRQVGAPPAGSTGRPEEGRDGIRLRFRTVSDRWTCGTLFAERRNVATLFRGPAPVWINPEDAGRIGILDNEWIELQAGGSSRMVRCVISRAVPRGVALGHAETYPFSAPKRGLRTGAVLTARDESEPGRVREGFRSPASRLVLPEGGGNRSWSEGLREVTVRRRRDEEGTAP